MAASGSVKLGWGLALRLARREMRHGFSGFRIFFLCLVLAFPPFRLSDRCLRQWWRA